MLNSRQSNEIKNWTRISSYGPKFQKVTGIMILITYFVVMVAISLLIGGKNIQDFNIDLFEIIILLSFTAFFVYIPIFIGKVFGLNNGKIILYEEGFVYILGRYQLISEWKDVKKIEIENTIPSNQPRISLVLLDRDTGKANNRLVAKIYTKNGDTGEINGFVDGKYVLPQEIQTSDLSLGKIDLMNEHCANMLYCIARRAYNAKWIGELSSINTLGWDIRA